MISNILVGQTASLNDLIYVNYSDSFSDILEVIKSDDEFIKGESNHELGTNGVDYFIGVLNKNDHLGISKNQSIRFTYSITPYDCDDIENKIISTSVVSKEKRLIKKQFKSLKRKLDETYNMLDTNVTTDKHLNNLKKKQISYHLDNKHILIQFIISDKMQESYVMGLKIIPVCP